MAEESLDAVRAERDRLAHTLAERTTQLEAVSKEFDQFTQTLSHDLRAPLRALEGFAQILIEDYGDKLDADGKRCVDTLAASAHKASALVEAMHGFSRTSRKPFNPCVVDMQKLAEQKVEELQVIGTKAKFRIDDLPSAWGDLDLLDSVLEELLRNAVKFSARQADPVVAISGRAEDSGTTYSVSDNGVGFDPKYAGRLFGVFQRLHDDKEFGGHGIGLATVQRLIHRHGGKVCADAQPNAGAVFHFSLPARPL